MHSAMCTVAPAPYLCLPPITYSTLLATTVMLSPAQGRNCSGVATRCHCSIAMARRCSHLLWNRLWFKVYALSSTLPNVHLRQLSLRLRLVVSKAEVLLHVRLCPLLTQRPQCKLSCYVRAVLCSRQGNLREHINGKCVRVCWRVPPERGASLFLSCVKQLQALKQAVWSVNRSADGIRPVGHRTGSAQHAQHRNMSATAA